MHTYTTHRLPRQHPGILNNGGIVTQALSPLHTHTHTHTELIEIDLFRNLSLISLHYANPLRKPQKIILGTENGPLEKGRNILSERNAMAKIAGINLTVNKAFCLTRGL